MTARITRIKSFNHDNVFLLSDEEAEKYLNRDARKCKPTSYAKAKGAFVKNGGYCWWWLCSPGPSLSLNVYGVNTYGQIHYHNYVNRNDGSVRPALWIDLES